MNRIAVIACCVVAGGYQPTAVCADPIRYWGQNAELTIGQVSDNTVRIHLAPLDETGVSRKGAPSSVLVDYPHQVKLQTRDLKRGELVQVGKMSMNIFVLDNLLVMRISNRERWVQDLIFDPTDGSMSFRTGGPILGLGEGDRQFDRNGGVYPAYNAKGGIINGQGNSLRPTHGGLIRDPFIIGAEGWAMFVHRPYGEFDLRDGKGKFLLPKKDAKATEPLEIFVINVTEPAVALAEHAKLTGNPALPPKWTMGYMQSHRTLAGPEEPVQIVKTFRDKKLPVDAVIYLGTGYCPAGWNVDNGTLDWNPKTFDRPAENIKALHDVNVKVVLHVNKAPRMFGASIKEKSENKIHISNYWNWHLPVFNVGIDGWWPDDGDELLHESRLARHRCYWEGPISIRPNERPWSLHRNGYAGVTKYGGWIWSGDVESRWATLAAHVPVGVNTSLSLTPYWGTDIGGFVPTAEFTAELYARWFQFGTFNPLMRSHGRTWKLRLPWGWGMNDFGPVETGAKNPVAKSELNNAEIEPICKKYLELRYALLPYNYTLMRESHDAALPAMRAMWLHYPNDPQAVKLGDQYLWGRDLLVAPVVEKGAKERSVYLPAGDWYDWWTGEKMSGNRTIKRAVDLATMPIYARAGAIVPLDPVRQYTSQAVTAPTTLRIYRGADGEYVLYDDDGKSLDYLKGQGGVWTKITWNDKNRVLVIEPDGRTKGAPEQQARVFNVRVVPDNDEHQVTYNGKRVEAPFGK